MKPINIYICVEIATREYKFKNKIKDFLNQKNFNVILNYTDTIIDGQLSGKLEPGVTIVKSIQRYTFKKLLLLKLIGARVIYLEEEAWVPFNDQDLLDRRLPKINLELCDLVLVPNKYLYNLVRDNNNLDANKFVFFGSNRMVKKSDSFKLNQFKTVLFIGSFGAIENQKKYLKIFLNELSYLKSIIKRRKYKRYFEYWNEDKTSLYELMNDLSLKGYKVFYRPHPSETNFTTSNKVTLLDNIEPIGVIANKFDLIIHSGSTCTFEISSPNIICVSKWRFDDININSKNHGPIIQNCNDLDKLMNSNFRCIYNDGYYVNEIDYSGLLSFLNHLKIRKTIFKNFIIFYYSLYLKYMSRFFRDDQLIQRKKFNIKSFEKQFRNN